MGPRSMMKVIRGAPLRLTTLQGASLLATRRGAQLHAACAVPMIGTYSTTHAMIEPLAPGGLYRLYTGVLRAPRRPVGVRTLEPDHRCGRSALERLERAPRAPHRAPRLSGRWVRWSSSARCGAPGVPPARRRHTLGWYTSPDALTRATAALRRDERRRGAQRARPKRGPTRGSWLEPRRRRGRGHVARSCSEL
jgi:hypothetical protein